MVTRAKLLKVNKVKPQKQFMVISGKDCALTSQIYATYTELLNNRSVNNVTWNNMNTRLQISIICLRKTLESFKRKNVIVTIIPSHKEFLSSAAYQACSQIRQKASEVTLSRKAKSGKIWILNHIKQFDLMLFRNSSVMKHIMLAREQGISSRRKQR